MGGCLHFATEYKIKWSVDGYFKHCSAAFVEALDELDVDYMLDDSYTPSSDISISWDEAEKLVNRLKSISPNKIVGRGCPKGCNITAGGLRRVMAEALARAEKNAYFIHFTWF